MPRLADGLVAGPDGDPRCYWCGDHDDYRDYHDNEWGQPVADDRRLFEKLCLEGFQSGLSWLTILRKREGFRRAFADFEVDRIVRFRSGKVESLLQDAAIVRHRGKIESVLNNARRVRELRQEHGSLAAYVWSFEPADNDRPKRLTKAQLMKMTTSDASHAMAKDLKKRGFSFVGPTTCYAFMQSMGLVNDHIEGCSARRTVDAARSRFRRP